MTTGGLSSKRLARAQNVLERHVASGNGPGAVGVVARHGEVHVMAVGNLAFEGKGCRTAMTADSIFRIASMTKPVVAACAMSLVEDGTLDLTSPVDDLLPELADRRVLVNSNGPLDDTVASIHPIVLHDLLTCRLGIGTILSEPGTVPIADALIALDHEVAPGVPPSPNEWLRRLGELPLVHQPGESWMYYIASNVLGILISRATGMGLQEVLSERILEPLGMKDTGFNLKTEDVGRLATAYTAVDDELIPCSGQDGSWQSTPEFKAAAGGLLSTAVDFHAFASALLANGVSGSGTRILSRPSVTLMTMDHLTQAQKEVSRFIWPPGWFDDWGWGFGVGITARRAVLGPSPGSYGWYGRFGTTWFNDPAEDMITILMIQSELEPMPVVNDFSTAAYQAIDD